MLFLQLFELLRHPESFSDAGIFFEPEDRRIPEVQAPAKLMLYEAGGVVERLHGAIYFLFALYAGYEHVGVSNIFGDLYMRK